MATTVTRTIQWHEIKDAPRLESRGGITYLVESIGQVWLSPEQHSDAIHFAGDEELIFINLQTEGIENQVWFFSGTHAHPSQSLAK